MDRAKANAEVLSITQGAQVHLTGMELAGEVVPGMHKKLIMHAGPPIEWERMCGPMQGAIIGALIYEGLAKDDVEAQALAASGEIAFEPNHHHSAIGPMTGVISYSMPVFIVKNLTYGNFAYSNVSEGMGRCLRYGAYGEDVNTRLNWMRDSLYPILKEAIERSGGIDVKAIVSQGVQMGDDIHNRNKASTSLFVRELAKYMVLGTGPKEEAYRVLEHIEKLDMFFFNITMAMLKALSDAAAHVPGSTIVTVMARNGVDFGIRVSGCGDKWFTAPANIPQGLYFAGYGEEDAARDIGDSAISETFGLGGFALAGSPGMVQIIGGSYEDGVRITQEMYEITTEENRNFKIPTMGFRGTPTGIDIVKVLKTGIEPTITTGIAHKEPGIGQVGAGAVKAPFECFVRAGEYMKENGL